MSDKKCSVRGCDLSHYGKGLCSRHYQRSRQGVPLDAEFREKDGTQGCSIKGCRGKHSAHGLCGLHDARRRRGADLSHDPIYGFKGCSVPGCDREHWSKKMCRRHGEQAKRYNLTVAEMIPLIGSPCMICGVSPETPFIDHDHSCCPQSTGTCGKCVRGVLCQGCNLGLGAFRDDPDRMRAAAKYIEEWNKP